MRFGLRAVEPPALGRVHLRPLLGEAVDDLAGELHRVGIGEHVPLPDDASHPRQLHAERLKPAPSPLLETLLAIGDLLPRGSGVLIGMAGILPMAVSEEDRRNFLVFLETQRAVEVAGDKQPRRAFKRNVGDGVSAGPLVPLCRRPLRDRAVERRIERRLLRHRPQPLRDEDPLPHLSCPFLPRVERGWGHEGEGAVEILERREAHIVGTEHGGQRGGEENDEQGAAAGCRRAGHHGEENSRRKPTPQGPAGKRFMAAGR